METGPASEVAQVKSPSAFTQHPEPDHLFEPLPDGRLIKNSAQRSQSRLPLCQIPNTTPVFTPLKSLLHERVLHLQATRLLQWQPRRRQLRLLKERTSGWWVLCMHVVSTYLAQQHAVVSKRDAASTVDCISS